MSPLSAPKGTSAGRSKLWVHALIRTSAFRRPQAPAFGGIFNADCARCLPTSRGRSCHEHLSRRISAFSNQWIDRLENEPMHFGAFTMGDLPQAVVDRCFEIDRHLMGPLFERCGGLSFALPRCPDRSGNQLVVARPCPPTSSQRRQISDLNDPEFKPLRIERADRRDLVTWNSFTE
jgi:hypothetical protein